MPAAAPIRLYQLKLSIGRIDVQLLTHYHSDHTSGVPDVWLTGWLESYFGTHTTPYRVIGPTGARQLIENLERLLTSDSPSYAAGEKTSSEVAFVMLQEAIAKRFSLINRQPFVRSVLTRRQDPKWSGVQDPMHGSPKRLAPIFAPHRAARRRIPIPH
jgi:ribonuclease BN (tRNA processing enzyme)